MQLGYMYSVLLLALPLGGDASCPVKNTAELVAAAKNTACAEIELAVGRYVLAATCGYDPTGLCLTRNVTLVGQPGVVLDGGGKVRVLSVDVAGTTVELRDLDITNGFADSVRSSTAPNTSLAVSGWSFSGTTSGPLRRNKSGSVA